MGVYLPNMEMPEKCGKCRFFAWSRGVGQHCAVASDITFHATIDGMDVAYERNGNCPLVPVPPHGDLIDRDALIKGIEADAIWQYNAINEYDSGIRTGARTVMRSVRNAPTIIPAEEGKI